MSYFKTKKHQLRFRLGLRPRSRRGSLQRSPDPLAGGEGADCPLPKNPIPRSRPCAGLDSRAFGVPVLLYLQVEPCGQHLPKLCLRIEFHGFCFYRTMHMHNRGICRHAVSVRLSVTFVSCAKMNKDTFEIFSPSGSQAILVFACQTGWRCSDGNPLNGGIECKGGMKK